MSRADERLRRLLLNEPEDALRRVLLALCVALSLALMQAGVLLPRGVEGEKSRLAVCLLLIIPIALALAAASRLAKRHRLNLLELLLTLALALVGMGLRLTFIGRASADYENYLAPWMAQLASGSFGDAMRRQIGEYNVLYQYLLFIAARLPVPGLIAVKGISLCGEALLAAGLARLAGEKKEAALTAFAAGLLAPSIALNGGLFAQCDGLYAACAVYALAFALEKKSGLSAACFALSLAFKLQALFLFPILPALYAAKRLRLADALIFLGALCLTALPALVGGKTPGAILSYYTGQTGLYTGLTYGAPTLFGLMNTQGLDVYAYGRLGVLLAAGACLLLAALGIARRERLARDEWLRLACLIVLTAVFLLPRMHERYFFLGGALLLCLAAQDRRAIPAAAACELAQFACLMDVGLPLGAASLLMLFAIVWLAFLPAKAQGDAA